MAFALSLSSSVALQCSPSSSCSERVFGGHPRTPNLLLPRHPPPPSSTLAFARRPGNGGAITSSSSSLKKKKVSEKKQNFGNVGSAAMEKDEEDLDDDPFEALFSQLEEDLKNDGLAMEDDDSDDINEEDIDRLANELAEALGDLDIGRLSSIADDGSTDVDEVENEEEEETPVKLKTWQLRRLAYALKAGRRKTSIKNLAAELCLDRAIVLELLRDPPPNLVMMSATLPDEPAPTLVVSETKPMKTLETAESVKPETKMKEPIHVMQHRWSAQKRLKKVQVETLERVYKRSKRPTNAMISSIVQVTNLPRKRVVKWFEDKRNEDGVPDSRLPYQRSVPETVVPN